MKTSTIVFPMAGVSAAAGVAAVGTVAKKAGITFGTTTISGGAGA